MEKELLNFLICPVCNKKLKPKLFSGSDKDISEGMLSCECGQVYPIIGSIPRIFKDSFSLFPDFCRKYKLNPIGINKTGEPCGPAFSDKEASLKEKTQQSFGYQWSTFSQMACDFEENFLNYIYPVGKGFFKGKFGLDAGCGFGRHIFNASKFGARMVGLDYSRAIESTYRNVKGLDNVYLVQADIYNLPFEKNTFDFVYSIGVLHHLPKPELAFRLLTEYVKPGGSIFIWVYSDSRKFTNFMLECVRMVTTKLPLSLLKLFCFLIAIIDYGLFIQPYRFLKRMPVLGSLIDKIILKRIVLYSNYPFQVAYADWFDRLSPPIRFYYNGRVLKEWFERAGLENIKISPTGNYGWRAYGQKP
ncbi:MAG: methyltransferase domain-containing protein [Candidatus Omnitrophota bacterium]|jgi:SAM-dependent methyltransferase/uncharacterized protein YbaR (Trm112 family)|nr:MAG: methyltransferase domain-containing protein [Candidatus Omnitrophota bacterium]